MKTSGTSTLTTADTNNIAIIINSDNNHDDDDHNNENKHNNNSNKYKTILATQSLLVTHLPTRNWWLERHHLVPSGPKSLRCLLNGPGNGLARLKPVVCREEPDLTKNNNKNKQTQPDAVAVKVAIHHFPRSQNRSKRFSAGGHAHFAVRQGSNAHPLQPFIDWLRGSDY